MQRAVTWSIISVFVAVPFISTGCGVQQDRYDHLLMAKRTAEEQAVRAESERDAARANLDAALDELASLRSSYQGLETRYGDLNSYVDDVAAENDAQLRQIASLELGPLPADLESAIRNLGAAYPDVLTFDASNGLIRFSSDFTFGLGSTDLTDDAERTLAELASILASASGTEFEVRVVGHTDTVPIRKAETRRKHPTNVHLSVHRAISVRDALVRAGVTPGRIEVSGFGEFRPIVSNAAGGAADNRRVEIYLKAGRNDSTLAMPESTLQSRPARPVVEPQKGGSSRSTVEPMK